MSHRPLLAALALALTSTACAVPSSELDFVAFPAGGSMALRGELAVHVSLGDDSTGRVPEVTVTVDDEIFTPACSIDAAGTTASCEALPELGEGATATIEVRRGDGRTRVQHVSAELPAEDLAWQLTERVDVRSFGEDPDAVGLLELLLERSGIVAVLADDQLLLGPASPVDGAVRVEAPGLTFALPVDRSKNGLLETDAVDGFLPLAIDGTAGHAYLASCALDGWIGPDDELVFVLSGTFPMATVDELIDTLGAAGALIRPSLVPDVDTDGDGVLDGVTFVVEGQAQPTVLKGWTV